MPNFIKQFNILVLLVVFVVSSCDRNTDYLDVVPDNAKYVSLINLKSILITYNVDEDIVKRCLTEYGLSYEGLESLQKILNGVDDIGIDWASPVCAFGTNDDCLYLTFKVDDYESLISFMKTMKSDGLSSSIKDVDGFQYVIFMQRYLLFFDKGTLLICSQPGKNDMKFILSHAKDVFAVNNSTNFKDRDVYQILKSESNDAAISVYYSDKVEFISRIFFEKNRMLAKTKLLDISNDLKRIINDFEKNSFTLTRDYFNEMPLDTALVWGGVGINGNWLLNIFKSNDDFKPFLYSIERGIDIESIIKSINGNCCFSLYRADNYRSNIPNLLLLSEVNNTSYLQEVPEWKKSMVDFGMSMVNISPGRYLLRKDYMKMYWGIDNNRLYISTHNDKFEITNANKKRHFLTETIGDDRVFICFNIGYKLKRNDDYKYISDLLSNLEIGIPQYVVFKCVSLKDLTIECILDNDI